MELDKRKQDILCAVIKAYIETGAPIGSKALIEREGLTVSSATVRNEMNELERLGYLRKPPMKDTGFILQRRFRITG